MTDGTDATAVDGKNAANLGNVFYASVALIALAGATGAAMNWLKWPLFAALGAVATLELGGITLAAWADFRMRLGERAYAARILSAAVAVFAVAVQWAGHHDRLQASFFAGMSALGYMVWLIQSGARRRDQLRADGKLPEVPPAYGLVQWLRHPLLTRRARHLALVDATLDLFGSIAAAREEIREERRHAAIATLLRRKIAEGKDALSAEIAVTVYDTKEIAKRLADAADYDGLADLLGADLIPRRMLPGQVPPPRRPKPVDNGRPIDRAQTDNPTGETTADPTGETAPATRQGARVSSSNRHPRPTTNKPTTGANAARKNATHLRRLYPKGLPLTPTGDVSISQIRIRTKWSHERAKAAVEAFDFRPNRQDDRQVDTPADRQVDSPGEATG